MSYLKKLAPAVISAALIAFLHPLPVRAADPIEAAGVGVGLTAGNAVAIPAKAISVLWGLTSGALSFILSGGNTDLTMQIWSDVTQGPYMITPEVAQKAVGERPELQKRQMTPEAAPSYTAPPQ